MIIEISIDSEHKETYEFMKSESTFVFVGYTLKSKPKGKRMWRTIKYWDKYSRESTIDEPIITEKVREQALIKAKEIIEIKTWYEWKGK